MSVAGVCRIVASILHNVQLTYVAFDQGTSACVGHDAWRSEGLPVLPSTVVARGWGAVLRVLRVRHAARLSRAQLTCFLSSRAVPRQHPIPAVRRIRPSRHRPPQPGSAHVAAPRQPFAARGRAVPALVRAHVAAAQPLPLPQAAAAAALQRRAVCAADASVGC
jgi:hypothetical protein